MAAGAGEGWTVTAAAEAAGVSVRCAASGLAGIGGRRALVCSIALRRRGGSPTDPARSGGGDRELRRLRMTAAEIAEHCDAALDRLGRPEAAKVWAGSAGSGSSRPMRYERSRPGELVHVDIKKLGRIIGGPGKRIAAGGTSTTQPRSTDAARPSVAAPSAGNTCTSPSTTTAAWPTPRCSPTRKPPPRSASSAAPSPSTPATGSPSSASSPTTAPPTSPPSTRSPADNSASATSAPAPSAHKPTAKPNASSAPCSTAGPTAPSTAQGSERTAALDGWLWHYNHHADTQPSATNPRPAEPTCLGPTARSALDPGSCKA